MTREDCAGAGTIQFSAHFKERLGSMRRDLKKEQQSIKQEPSIW